MYSIKSQNCFVDDDPSVEVPFNFYGNDDNDDDDGDTLTSFTRPDSPHPYVSLRQAWEKIHSDEGSGYTGDKQHSRRSLKFVDVGNNTARASPEEARTSGSSLEMIDYKKTFRERCRKYMEMKGIQYPDDDEEEEEHNRVEKKSSRKKSRSQKKKSEKQEPKPAGFIWNALSIFSAHYLLNANGNHSNKLFLFS